MVGARKLATPDVPAETPGLDKLADTIGMKRSTARNIARQVAENNRKLNGCGGHDFHAINADDPLRTKWECEKCGGVIGNREYLWYMHGREHEASDQKARIESLMARIDEGKAEGISGRAPTAAQEAAFNHG